MFTPQDNTGTVAGANAYISVAEFDQYFDDRGQSPDAFLPEEKQGAIVRATSFIDTVYKFTGYKLAGDIQTTEFPRYLETKPDPAVAEIPKEIKEATCELAMYVLSGKALFIDLSAEETGIKEIDNMVGKIRERIEYTGSNTSGEGYAYCPYAEFLLEKSGWLLQSNKGVISRA